MKVDILAIGAHPDDVELGVGGLLHKLSQSQHTVGILDLTRGEMGTRGTPEERAEEGQCAARILGVAVRESVGLPDGGLMNTQEQRLKIIPYIRKYMPSVLLIPRMPDRHPDHATAHQLVSDANYLSGLARIDTGTAPHRTPQIYFYHPYAENDIPPVIVDITDHFETKLAALRAHRSQFYDPEYEGASTYISSKSFWESITTRAAYWGSRIGETYGEALYPDGSLKLDSLPGLPKNKQHIPEKNNS